MPLSFIYTDHGRINAGSVKSAGREHFIPAATFFGHGAQAVLLPGSVGADGDEHPAWIQKRVGMLNVFNVYAVFEWGIHQNTIKPGCGAGAVLEKIALADIGVFFPQRGGKRIVQFDGFHVVKVNAMLREAVQYSAGPG